MYYGGDLSGVSNCRIVAHLCDRSFKTGDRWNQSNIVQLTKCMANRAFYIFPTYHAMQILFNLSELCQFIDVIYRSIIIDVRLISWCKLMKVWQTICRTKGAPGSTVCALELLYLDTPVFVFAGTYWRSSCHCFTPGSLQESAVIAFNLGVDCFLWISIDPNISWLIIIVLFF